LADQYKKPYLDSSVFIAWIKGEIIEGVDRKKIAEHILNQASRGEFQIYTSTLTLAEVHKPRHGTRLADDQDERILAYFEHDFFRLVDVDRNIAEQANRLCREHNIAPNDAIHVACALRAGCDVLLAWDDKLIKVKHPKLQLAEPQMLGQHEMDLGE
jgi:predicted nucleic acid-binding protein